MTPKAHGQALKASRRYFTRKPIGKIRSGARNVDFLGANFDIPTTLLGRDMSILSFALKFDPKTGIFYPGFPYFSHLELFECLS